VQGRKDMKETEVCCPNCGDCDYPEYVECRGCQKDVTQLFRDKNILSTFFEIREKPQQEG
jgi:hypothetical protein